VRIGFGFDHFPELAQLSVAWSHGEFPMIVEHVGLPRADLGRRGPGGLSTGFLVTRPSSVRNRPFFRAYNEDWLWLLMLGPSEQVLRQAETAVVHAPRRGRSIGVHALVQQEVGEVLFDVASSLWGDDSATDVHRFTKRLAASTALIASRLSERLFVLECTSHDLDKLACHSHSTLVRVRLRELSGVFREASARLASFDFATLSLTLDDFAVLASQWERHITAPDISSHCRGLLRKARLC
jgi:hypothetical protein